MTFLALEGAMSQKALMVKTEKANACPETQPSACSAYSSCQCVDSGSFYFYKCDGLWCNNICEGCHGAEEPESQKAPVMAKPGQAAQQTIVV